jgi:small subunit ribosomal protein S2
MSKDSKINTEEMAQAGVQFGHKVSRLHPKMKQYILGIKNNVHTFDLEKTAAELQKAIDFISKLVANGKSIIFVGTKPQLRGLVKAAAEECEIPYVTERWLGGTFTNFETIKKRVEYFKDLEKKKASGELEKYTKKERLNFDKELESLRIKFEGIKNLAKLPETVFIFDLDKNETCAREAKIKGIKIIAIVDTNINPNIVDYIIPANDDAISSVSYIINQVSQAIKNSKISSKQ